MLKSSVDRAGAEAEYSARFQRANVLAADIERVLASAYLYRIQVRGFAADPWVCRDKLVEEEYEEEEPAKNPGEQPRRVKKTRTRKQEECFAGGPTAWSDRPRMRVTLATAVLFDKANLQGQGEPLVSPVCALGAQGSGEAPYPAPPRPPEKPERSAYPSHEAYDRALAQYEEALAEHQRQLALYRERVPQLQREATLKTIPGLAAQQGASQAHQLKSVPEFRLKTPVIAVVRDRVEFMLGRAEGLRLDDAFEVTEFDTAGQNLRIGYVKVREIGDPLGSGGGTPSQAEKVREEREIVGGELLLEHPMFGVNFNLTGVFEIALKDLLGRDGAMSLAGGALSIESDIANLLGVPELYFVLQGEYLQDLSGGEQSPSLVHVALGLDRKWYEHNWVLVLGGQLVFGTLSGAGADADSLQGVGGNAVLGLERYHSPEFSWSLQAQARFVTWLTDTPLPIEPEIGLALTLGLRFGV